MSATETKPLIKLTSVTLLSNKQIAEGVYVLSFKRDFEFVAGQVLGLALAATDDARLYSIASGEKDENIEVLYNVKPGGKLTPELSLLTAGSNLWITPPFGSYSSSDEASYWISAGTGIAPFRSMLRSGIGSKNTFIHGGRKSESFYFENELKDSYGERYIRCCSQQKIEGTFHGRVTNYLDSIDQLPLDQKYYLCGSAEMVVECRDILISKGIAFQNIVAEIYF